MNYKRIVVVFIASSSRSQKFSAKVRPGIENFAKNHNLKLREIELSSAPIVSSDGLIEQKLSDREIISKQLRDGDLVVACGGDGIVQMCFDAAFLSEKDVTFAAVPLGNGNDFARALNGRATKIEQILDQTSRNFYPLLADFGEIILAIAAYITFGATTTLVDILNQEEVRRRRKFFANLSPAASLPIGKIRELSSTISKTDFPDFSRNGKNYSHDSLGFFNTSAAHGVLRISRKYLFAKKDFFFHLGSVADKNLLQKILMAGRWTLNFPGSATTSENIIFAKSRDLVANIAGDNIKLKNIREIRVQKSDRAIKVLTSRKS